jgi:hypothetical protein
MVTLASVVPPNPARRLAKTSETASEEMMTVTSRFIPVFLESVRLTDLGSSEETMVNRKTNM